MFTFFTLSKLKQVIVAVTVLIIFYALISPMLLENVVIRVQDALIITFGFVIMSQFIIVINLKESGSLEKKLLIQHEQLQTLLANSPIILYLKEPDGKILYANQPFADLFRCPLNEIIGKTTYELYVNDHFEQDRWILENKKPLRLEDKVDTGEGYPTWFSITKAPVLGKNNKVERIIVFLKNIDIEKQIEERKNTYVATLTHDLKTPTNAQLRVIDLLLKDCFGELTAEQKEIITEVKKSCLYMNNLISNILVTYTSECGKLKVNYETFDAKEMAEMIATSLKKLAEEREQYITVINEDISKSIIISADKFHIKRVFLNLISNAIYHGEKQSEIKVVLHTEKDKLFFKVINNGQYISKEEIEEVFEKFKSVEHSKKYKTGTGLGLYLAKEIVVSHNGEVFASSTPNGVCTFGFWIPKESQKSKLPTPIN